MNCPGCNQLLRWWERSNLTNTWHARCWKSYGVGYEDFMRFANNECYLNKQPTPFELYENRMKGIHGVITQ